MKAQVLIITMADIETNPRGEIALIHITDCDLRAAEGTKRHILKELEGRYEEIVEGVFKTGLGNLEVLRQRKTAIQSKPDSFLRAVTSERASDAEAAARELSDQGNVKPE